MKKKLLGVIVLIFAFTTQVLAVLNEQNLDQTVSVLKAELEKTYKEETEMRAKYDAFNKMQHMGVMQTIQESEKIALMLYSQKQDFIFDMAYACHEATVQYRQFKEKRMPFDVIIKNLDNEIKRYTLLIETLESIPPMKRKWNRDSLRIARSKEDSIKKAMAKATAAYEAEKYGKITSDSANKEKGVGINIFGRQLGGDTATTSAEEMVKLLEAKQDSLILAKAREITKEVSDSAVSINDSIKLPSAPNIKRFNMAEMKQFSLSEGSQIERDSCVALSKRILADFIKVRDHIIKDKKLYDHIDARLKSVNDYALDRYEAIQQSIFTNKGNNYFDILKSLPMHSKIALNDVKDKYVSKSNVPSDWQGPTIIGLVFFIFAFLIVAAIIAKFILKMYSKHHPINKTFLPYYTITLTCLLFTILCSLTKLIVSQNFFTMACSRLIEYVLLIAAITLSLVYRTGSKQIKSSFSCYFPILLMGLVIIIFRIMFVPNNLVVMLFPPMLIIFTIWGFRSVKNHHANIPKYDEIYAWISLTIMTVACVMAWLGYSLLAVEVFIWWLVQLTCIQALTFASEYMKKFEIKHVAPRILAKEGFSKENTEEYKKLLGKKVKELQTNQGDNITHTWFFDLVTQCLIPVAAVLSFLLCIYIATDIFDLTAMCKDIFFTNFLDIEGLCQLSLFKLVVVLEFYFIFRFIAYISRAIYKHWKLKNKKLHEIERANITLANNLIAIVVWGIYFIFILFLLQVPKSGISIVSAGLATGLGFAMRDMLNNFFYGITLMTGRVRVGDFIECDGVRGKVESITYQSTQLITLDGCVVAFLNATLFTKTFKNLTRNHGYELVKIPIGVAYGTDVENVRKILEDKLDCMHNEKTGSKPNVDPEKKIGIYFNDFGDSSVDLYAVMWILVENKFVIVSRAKEIIYNALNENNIEIPFPQRDLHIINTPSQK
ncbi:MAG: mechanosensitive ion channel family protein [Paludibacteraceae bacterium]|nr:mechanosensitive ion channel family protein [Paludibacteraceae bacterium]